MKQPFALSLILGAAGVFAVAGCSSTERHPVTNNPHPGPVAGQAAGAGVGVVVGNIAGFGAGFAGGLAAGVSAPFTPTTTRVVRTWQTETTADGRTIQVPVDIAVDELG